MKVAVPPIEVYFAGMAEQPHHSIRNDNLRLILSSHESDFIDSGLREAELGLRQILIVGALALCATAVMVGLLLYGDSPTVIDNLVTIALVFAIVTVLVCSVNGLGAYFSLKRFRSYRDDHDKFLKHYRRDF